MASVLFGLWAGSVYPVWEILERFPVWKRLLITAAWPAILGWLLLRDWVRI